MASSGSLAKEDPVVYGSGESAAGNPEVGKEIIIKKTKKVHMIMPRREVEYVLSYKPFRDEPEVEDLPESFVRRYPELAASYYAEIAKSAPLEEKIDEERLEQQRDSRQQIGARGYVTYEVEVTDDEEEEEISATAAAA